MNKECWFQVVVPLLQINETATIGITTIEAAPDNHVADLIRRKIFPLNEISLVCNDCKLLGQTDKCIHMAHLVPKWQSDPRREFVQTIYPPDQSDRFAMEIQGISKMPSNACFDPDLVYQVFSSSRYKLQEAQRYLFCAIDPCAGSIEPEHHISDFSWMTAVSPGLKIMSSDSIEIHKLVDCQVPLLTHLNEMMKRPYLMNAKLVVFIEGNMKTEARTVRNMIREVFPLAVFPSTHPTNTHAVGVLTTAQTKQDSQAYFQSLLQQQHGVQIAHDFFSLEKNPNIVLDKLRNQWIEYSKFAKAGKTPLCPTRYTFTGKITSRNRKDDLAIVTQILANCMKIFFENSAWFHYHI
jgi:hypothetical protein